MLFSFLRKIGAEAGLTLGGPARELATTSCCTAEIDLAEAPRSDVIALYRRRAIGEKYLMNPNKPVA